ncbi:unnamed protein product [Sphacelaria rigidula]
MGMIRCLLNETRLPPFLWNELAAATVYLANRFPNKAIDFETTYYRMFGKQANLAHLRAVGSRAFVQYETNRNKLEEEVWEGRPVGFESRSKAYRIYRSEN